MTLMPEAIAQIGQAYQPTGPRPIPTDWPRQNPVSWVDPATGMTPGQFGQGVIGAGKEIPNLMWSALPRQQAIDPKTGRAFPTPALFPPRGREQETGARMMDILSWLHGMNPVGMEETAAANPRFAEDYPIGSEEWWKPDWKPSVETLRSISNDQKRLYQLQQALLNRARRGEKVIPYEHLPLSVRTRALPPEAPGGAPLTPEETAKYPNVVERPPSGAEYPSGSIGAEAQKPPETRLVRRPGPPEGWDPMNLFEIKLNSLGPLGEFMGMKVSPINQKAYHVYDSWFGHLLGGFDTHEEAIEFINRAINSPVTEELPPRDIQSWKWPEEYLERMPRDHKGLLSPKNPPKEFGTGDYYSSNGNGH